MIKINGLIIAWVEVVKCLLRQKKVFLVVCVSALPFVAQNATHLTQSASKKSKKKKYKIIIRFNPYESINFAGIFDHGACFTASLNHCNV